MSRDILYKILVQKLVLLSINTALKMYIRQQNLKIILLENNLNILMLCDCRMRGLRSSRKTCVLLAKY